MNEINRMEGIFGDMIRPVRGDYLEQMKQRKTKLENEMRVSNMPPPMRM